MLICCIGRKKYLAAFLQVGTGINILSLNHKFAYICLSVFCAFFSPFTILGIELRALYLLANALATEI